MFRNTAIVYAPGEKESELTILVKKMEAFLEWINLFSYEIRFYASPLFHPCNRFDCTIPSTLIIGWGLFERPDWSKWTYEMKTSSVVRLFIAVDLYEHYGAYGRVLMVPNLKNGHYWRSRFWQTRLKLFLNGCFINPIAPYGMRRIPIDEENCNLPTLASRHTLVPGSPQEIEIVRLVFNLYVDFGYTFTGISNLLNAQSVTAPNKSPFWNARKVRSLLASAFYIGSNQYSACIKHNVFPALIDRSTFYAAQAKIYGK